MLVKLYIKGNDMLTKFKGQRIFADQCYVPVQFYVPYGLKQPGQIIQLINEYFPDAKRFVSETFSQVSAGPKVCIIPVDERPELNDEFGYENYSWLGALQTHHFDPHKAPFHKHVVWCKDNDIKVYFDYCWEAIHPFKDFKYEFPLLLQYMKKYDIKILGHWESKFNDFYDPEHFKLDKNFESRVQPVDRLFEFEFRSKMWWHDDARPYEIDTWPRKLHEKQYRFVSLVGDMCKEKNIHIVSEMDRRGLWDDGWWHGIKKDYLGRSMHKKYYKDIENRLARAVEEGKPKDPSIKHLHANFDKYCKFNPYELRDDIYKRWKHRELEKHIAGGALEVDNIHERKVPDLLNEGKLSIIMETHQYPFFYTEKTYKHIWAENAFVFGGVPFINKCFAAKGYQIFDELFDYSFEDYQGMNICHQTGGYVHEVINNRLCDQLEKITHETFMDNAKSIEEKTQYNKYHFLKRTCTDSFVQWLEKLFL